MFYVHNSANGTKIDVSIILKNESFVLVAL